MGTPKEERRNLTILFADISGFTRLSSGLDPEDVREVVTTCFEILNKPIVHEEGTIHRYEGDSVIALFGLPTAHEDDPERAIKASLAMMDLIPHVNEALSQKLGKPTAVGLHAGINRGTVVVGEMGSKEKKEYTILGEAVNLASRLKDVAGEGEILVSDAIFRESRYLFDYEACEPTALKGIDTPVRIFKPVRLKEKPEPKRGIKGLCSPMVGRSRELDLMMDRVRELSRGNGGATFILGPAGIGKSRLLQELKHAIAAELLSIHQLEGSVLCYGEALPYWPFLQMLRAFFCLTHHDPEERIREKLTSKTRNILADTADDILPYLGYLFSIRFPGDLDEKIKHLDARALKMQIFISIKKVLEAIAGEKPLLMIIEDFHWIDKESLQLLTFLLDAPQPSPIAFLCLSRIEKDTEPFKTKENLKALLGAAYQEIQLPPLNAGASHQLVNNLLSIANISKPLKETILSKAEGNPFYVEEIIRSLIDTEVLEFSNGAWTIATGSDMATHEPPPISIPDSVQGVIRTRLDRLAPDIKGVLENASIIGRNFLVPLLENLCSTDRLLLSMHLAILEEYEYIIEFKRQPEAEYLFRHPMLHEVTYNSILKKKRKELHARTAHFIEQTFADRLDDFTELLAHQYSRSDNTVKAIEWIRKAANKAKDRYANDEAISCFQTLIDLIGDNKEKHREALLDAHGGLGSIYALKGEYKAAIEQYESMHRYAGEDRITASGAKRKIAMQLSVLGEWDRSLEIISELESSITGDSVDEMVEQFEICALASSLYKLRGELDRALEYAEKGEKIINSKSIERSKDLVPEDLERRRAMGMSSKASVFYTKRELSRAIEIWEAVLQAAQELDDKIAINSTLNNLGVAYYAQGKFKKAEAAYERSLAISEAIGDKQITARTSTNLAVIHYKRGDFNKAIELFTRGLAISEETGDKQGIAVIGANLGIVHCDAGEHEKAIKQFQRQLEISRKLGHTEGILNANKNLGHFYTDRGEYDRAADHHQRAIASAEILNNKHAMGEQASYLASTYLRCGDLENARKTLEKAHSLLAAALRDSADKEEALSTITTLAATKISLAQFAEGKEKKELLRDAAEHAQRALDLSKELHLDMAMARIQITIARLHVMQSKLEKSEELFAAGIRKLMDLHQKRVAAHAYLDHAKVLKTYLPGSSDALRLARKHAEAAKEIFRGLHLSQKVKECNAM